VMTATSTSGLVLFSHRSALLVCDV
jgi:hypothetical protein